MAGMRALLAQIEADVQDDKAPLSSTLQKCILLGSEPGAEQVRDWARRELKGYVGAEELPYYRHVHAVLMAVITNERGYQPITQRIEASLFPDQIREMIVEKVDLEDATLGDGLGVLEELANGGRDDYQVVPYWAGFIVDTLNRFNSAPNSRVTALYWSLPRASLKNLLVQARTTLIELLADLPRTTPDDDQPHPIEVAGNAGNPTPGTIIYYGPVVHGDATGARLAWGNRDVDQSQTSTEQVAPGFESLAEAVATALEQLSVAGLSNSDHEDAEVAAQEVLSEVKQPEPNKGKIRRALASLKWLLAPIAAGAASGAGGGAQEWARKAIETFSVHL